MTKGVAMSWQFNGASYRRVFLPISVLATVLCAWLAWKMGGAWAEGGLRSHLMGAVLCGTLTLLNAWRAMDHLKFFLRVGRYRSRV